MKTPMILKCNILLVFFCLMLPCVAALHDEKPDPALAHQLGLSVQQLQTLQARYPLSREALLAASPMQIQTLLWNAQHPEIDLHAEAQKFHAMRLKDEHGNIAPGGLARALKQHYNNGHHYGYDNGHNPHGDNGEDDGGEEDLFPVFPDPSTNQPDGGSPVPFYAGIQNTNWTWLGPGNIGGRIRSIIIHPTQTNVMWCGGVDGGVWKTLNGGTSWFPLNDFMANLAIGCMVLDWSDTNVLYAGTGEGTYNIDAIRGAGIFKSFDGGSNWFQLPGTISSSFQYVNRLSMDPTNSQVLLAATRGGIWRTANGGTNWSFRLGTEMLCIAFNPTDSTQAIASGYNGHTYYSIDGGVTWVAATGIPAPSGFVVGRVELAYSASNPLIVYASVDTTSRGSIYQSTDGGHSYTNRSTTGTNYLSSQGWYDNFVWADPFNTNIVVVGGTDVYRSTDGGMTLTDIGGYSGSIHPDQHVLVANPLFNGTTIRTVFVGNDGGLFRATDIYTASSSSGWANLNHNLGITQFYGAAGNSNTSVIVGGTQDNGTLRYTLGGGAQGWTSMFGGDGGFAAADLSNSSYFYGEYVYLQIHRSANGGTSSGYIYAGVTGATNGIGDAGSGSTANFIAPFILDPNNPNTMLAGGVSLWRSLSVKATTPTWSAIKPSVSSPISAIAVAPGNSDVIYVGHNNGVVYYTANGTAATPTWSQRNSGLPARNCTSLAIAPSGRVYATFGGYSSGNVWQSSNNGLSWVNITANLPAAPMNSIVVAPADTNTLYVASEVGIYGTSNNGGTWATGNNGPANVSVDQLFWMGNKLVAVSHGRGIWSTIPNLGPPVLAPAGTIISGGNGNGVMDPNECNNLVLTITNGGGTSASGIAATLSSPTPGVSFLQNTSSYGTLPSGASGANATAFRIGTTSNFVCGTPVVVNASLTYAGGSTNITYTLPSSGFYAFNQTNSAALIPGDTDIGNHSDNDVTSLPLPFPVTIYASSFTNVNVAANGNLQFISANSSGTNACLPTSGFNYAVFPFWTDLRTDLPGQGIFTTLAGATPNRIFGIEWRASVVSSSSNVNFEVLFYESQPRIDIVYGNLEDSGTAATVGIQSDIGSSYTNFECNAGGLTAGLQLSYQWSCNDGGGTCPPPVIPAFTADNVSGAVPLLVNFTNLTTGATNYTWTFGDGNTSTDFNPTNLYLNAGKYSVTLTAIGAAGTTALTRTNYITVTNVPPAITVQPVGTIVPFGSNAAFSVAATGTAPLSYQWRLAGVPIANATSSILTRNNTACADAGTYDAIVTNAAGSVASAPALLTVVAPPGIASQPVDQSVLAGQTAQFTVTATNACGGGLTYQWQFFGTNLLGSTSASLTISNVGPANAGLYDVLVTNFAGSVTSTVAMLNLANPAPVVILSPTLVGSNLVFYFATDPGKNYTIQYKDALDGTNWQNAQTFPGDGATNTFFTPISDATQRFFRLSVQ
jgi:PKD repeat protein